MPRVTGILLVVFLAQVGCWGGQGIGSDGADAANYYVSVQGNDNADGQTPETAFRTIGRALERVQPGGTVLILPGTYYETGYLEGQGNPEAPLTIRGHGGTPKLDGQNTRDAAFWIIESASIVLEDLEITGYTDAGIVVSLSSRITLRRLTVHHNGSQPETDWAEGYGIHVDESRHVAIEANQVFANGPRSRLPGRLGTGINTFRLQDAVISNNQVVENIGGGILVEDGVDVLVQGNEIRLNDLDASADGWWDGGIWLDGGQRIAVRDNTIEMNAGPGIEVSDEDHQQPYGYVLENNISTGNYYGIYIWNFGTTGFPPENILRLVNNQISGNAWRDVWIVPWNCPPPDPCGG
ncbi:MAG: right-handed parallel beta-helix repeat-containing protein [Deinococcus sp.]|nr:right-handed parallel beta-helix repeat-containing protein [Deinococcus sp.]